MFDEFRFHLTLTGPADRDDLAALLPHIEAHFSSALGEPLWIEDIALFIEPTRGAPFRLVRRFPLGG